MEVQIRELQEREFERWNAFVDAHPQATFFHRAEWKTVLERAFGHATHFLYAERGGKVVGVLPLAMMRSFLFGNSLTSLPFCVYGGIVAEDQAAGEALRRKACELADGLGVDALELRNREPSGAGWPVKELYVTFRKTIDPDPEANLKAIPRKQRAMVRKGIKAGLGSVETTEVERLYAIYAESVRNLGTPVFSRRYFEVLREVFGDACRILMIRHQGEDIAGVMSFYFRDEVLPYYGGSLPAARALKGNDFMYWELMRRSAEEGVRVFDYGRSKVGTGPYSFKKNWGFTPEPLPYEYYLVRAKSIPEVNPTNPKYRLFIEAWKRLPLPIANRLGPFLAKSLG